ncbi:MAG TPA: DUF6766 family protein [Thermoleophilaceae bacterium]|jgi:hypothetical protein
MRFVKNSSLSLVFLALFLGSLAGQAIAGHEEYNNDEVEHARLMHEQPETLSLGRYVTSSSFGRAVAENWQSEYLQFTLFILGTVWLLQRGSTESKRLDQAGREADEDQRIGRHADPDSPRWAKVGGIRTFVYSNSLLLVMGLIFVASWFAQSVTGWSTYNADQIEHQAHTVSWLGYVGSANFWESTLQNWQSEFLAIGSMAVLSIYLRQRGSPESKPVGAPHDATAEEG